MTDTTTPAPAAPDTTTTAVYITESTLCALLGEVNERLAKAEAVNAVLIAEVDALAAEVAQLKASA